VELRQPGIRPEDRLATAVFVVALFHGLLILGLRFTAPSSDERPLPTLEVLLVPHGEHQDPNPEASYISERDQRGAGTTRERMRTSLPEASARLLEHSGEAGGEAFAERAATSTRGGRIGPPAGRSSGTGWRRGVAGRQGRPARGGGPSRR